MNIVRKWPIARAEHIDEDGIAWIAESRAGTGTWVIREAGHDNLVGHAVEFDDNREGVMLPLSPEIRKALKMPEEVYFELEVQLRQDYEKRQEEKVRR